MPERLTATSPQALHALLEDAFNRADLDAYAGAYEVDAALVTPPQGRIAYGRDAIRAAAVPVFAAQPRMQIVVEHTLQTEDLALTGTRWRLVCTNADGTRNELSGRAAVVSRRRPDGTWGIVLDNPLSESSAERDRR